MAMVDPAKNLIEQTIMLLTQMINNDEQMSWVFFSHHYVIANDSHYSSRQTFSDIQL